MSTTKETKTEKVRKHLIKFKSITSWQAIELYKATRLAAIICNLNKKGWVIDPKQMSSKNKDGETSRFVKYMLVSHPKK
jgi:hypothetical protein